MIINGTLSYNVFFIESVEREFVLVVNFHMQTLHDHYDRMDIHPECYNVHTMHSNTSRSLWTPFDWIERDRIFSHISHKRINTRHIHMSVCELYKLMSPWSKWPPFRRRCFRMHFREWKFCTLIKNSLKFIPKGPIDITPAFVWIMHWCRIGDKPLSEPMLIRFTGAYMRHYGEIS